MEPSFTFLLDLDAYNNKKIELQQLKTIRKYDTFLKDGFLVTEVCRFFHRICIQFNVLSMSFLKKKKSIT